MHSPQWRIHDFPNWISCTQHPSRFSLKKRTSARRWENFNFIFSINCWDISNRIQALLKLLEIQKYLPPVTGVFIATITKTINKHIMPIRSIYARKILLGLCFWKTQFTITLTPSKYIRILCSFLQHIWSTTRRERKMEVSVLLWFWPFRH